MYCYKAPPNNILEGLTQWMIALVAICFTLAGSQNGIAQELSPTELITIRDFAASRILEPPVDQDDKNELDRIRRTYFVVGLLIDLQKKSGEASFDIPKLSLLEKHHKNDQTEDDLLTLEVRHLQLWAEVLVQRQAFLQLHRSTAVPMGSRAEATKVGSNSESSTSIEDINWMQLWDREKSKLVAGELTSIRKRAKSLLEDKADLTAEQVNAVLAIGKQFVEEQTKADLKTVFEREAVSPTTQIEPTSQPTVSSSVELNQLLDLYTSLVMQLEEIEDPVDDSRKERLGDEYSQLHEKVEAIREFFVSQRASSIAHERLLIYGLLHSQPSELSREPSVVAQGVKESDFSVSAPLAALLTADEFLREAIDELSTDKPKWIVKRFFDAAWKYELTFGEEASVTIGEIILLIASLSSAIILSFVCSRFIGRYIVPWFGISVGASIAWRLIIRNVLALLFTFIAFQLFGVPLTAFAFVGGAAALAVGFGSKDIANNFMSGLIILTEQPIRVNDVILYDSKQCLVTYIGLRSTRLRNLENHDLVVPNSVLIDRLVTNLTLMNNRIRLVLPLEVDRTENVEQSISLMVRKLKQLPSIHHEIAPDVFLKSVDTYYLNFEIHVTVEFNDLEEINRIQSEVLRSVSQLFPSKPDEPAESEGDSELGDDDALDSQTENTSRSHDQAEVAAIDRSQSWMKCSKKELEYQLGLLKQALKTK